MGRNWVKHILSIPAQAIGFQNLLRLSGKKLILPFYHAVSDKPLPHIAPLYTHKTVTEFEADLAFLLQHFTPIGLEEVHAFSKGELRLEKPSFHLTFDDGLREVFTSVSPLLKKYGIPATVFVNPDFVGNKALFFRYKAALLINELENRKMKGLPAFPFDTQVKNVADWTKWILSAKHHQTGELDQLAQFLEIDFQAFLEKEKPYLDLTELQELSRNGMEIGAHSLNHPEYRFISLDEQIRQTTESIAWVKEHFKPKVAAFSFPFTDFGVGKGFFVRMKSEPNCPDLFFGTAGLNVEVTQNHLQRIPMEASNRSAKNVLQTELLASIIKQKLGKEVISRG